MYVETKVKWRENTLFSVGESCRVNKDGDSDNDNIQKSVDNV